MKFKKDQKVQWGHTQGVTILAGPFINAQNNEWYAVRQANGTETWALTEGLKPLPPQVGDKGRRGKGHERSCPLRVIREINDNYVVTERVNEGESRGCFMLDDREYFDQYWRAES